MKNILLIILTFILVQCHRNETNKQDATVDQDKFFVINYEKSLQNKKTINLSEIASEVKYIPLQTDTNCLLGRMLEYHFTDEYIFIGNRDHVLVFDYNGRFVRKIGAPGKGPNEIDMIQLISVDNLNKTIVIQTLASQKLLFFSFDGTFLESVPLTTWGIEYVLDKDKFLEYNLCIMGNEEYVFRLTNRKGDTISTVRNHFKWENKTGIVGMLAGDNSESFYRHNDCLYFKSMYNDTVYKVSENELKPAYFIDLGQYKLPDDSRFENPASRDKFQQVRGNYFIAGSMEAGNQLFMTSTSYDDKIRRIIHQKRNDPEGVFLVNEFGEPSGFVNDWDGGPEFWPKANANDKKVFMTVSPADLKGLIEKEGFTDINTLYPEKKKELIDMIKNLNEDDNEVIMIVTLK